MWPSSVQVIRTTHVRRFCQDFVSNTQQISIYFSSKEKKYVHYIAQASWAGARIIQGQWTPQAEKLYDLLILTFSDNGSLADLTELKKKSGISEEEWDDLVQYTVQVKVVRCCAGYNF
jgi:hypothetical protein